MSRELEISFKFVFMGTVDYCTYASHY